MTTKTWTIDIEGRKHIIELKHGYFSGKREIRVDGTLIEENRKLLDMGSDHTFQVAGHTCSIHIRTNYSTFEYDCGLDGISVLTGLPVDYLDPSRNPIPLNNQTALLRKWKLSKQLKGSVSWFYVIAALSIINSLIFIFNGSLSFVVGLGFTQFIDGISYGVAEISDPGLTPIIRTIGLVINLGIAGGFIGLGIIGSKGKRWAIITGIVLYILDLIILILALDWLSIIFHLMALLGIFRGLRACSELAKLEAQSFPSVIESI